MKFTGFTKQTLSDSFASMMSQKYAKLHMSEAKAASIKPKILKRFSTFDFTVAAVKVGKMFHNHLV
jgi:hypothetical protein